MSKVVYHANLSIVIWKKEELPDSLDFEVDFFEVDGGVNRKIEIGKTDEFNIGSEFYEARTYKNIILYIRADNESHKLIELFKSGKKDFSIFFSTLVWSNGHFIRQMQIRSFATNFAEIPAPVGKTPPLLKAKMILNGIRLLIGTRDEKRDVMHLKEI